MTATDRTSRSRAPEPDLSCTCGRFGPQTHRSWDRESDMLPAVLTHQGLLAPGTTWRTFYEVAGPRGGIVDVIWVRFSRAALASRPPAASAALDLTSIRALQALSAGVSGAELAACIGVSRGHLSQSVLRRLSETGWLERAGRTWVLTGPYRPTVTAVVTAELKRGDWRTALKQAGRHRAAVDASWVVMDATRSGPARAAAAPFAHAGVGLAQLAMGCRACAGGDHRLDIVHRPHLNSSMDFAGRAFFGEQCLQLLLQGKRTGPARQVFGRLL